MKGLKFVFVFDDRHGWLRMPLADYWRAGIHHRVSGYSYADAKHVYLEEDVDAGIYLDAIGHVDANTIPFRELRGSFPDAVGRDIVRFDHRRPAAPVAVAGKEAR